MEIQPMPELTEEYVQIDFGGHLDAFFHRKLDRPTLYFARPGMQTQLGRLDPFAVPQNPRGHYHTLPPVDGDSQKPFTDFDPAASIFALAIGHMEPSQFRKILREAEANDIADAVPDEVILVAVAQYHWEYAQLS